MSAQRKESEVVQASEKQRLHQATGDVIARTLAFYRIFRPDTTVLGVRIRVGAFLGGLAKQGLIAPHALSMGLTWLEEAADSEVEALFKEGDTETRIHVSESGGGCSR